MKTPTRRFRSSPRLELDQEEWEVSDTNEYELDTSRAKSPADRLRIVADLMDAQERGEQVWYVRPSDGLLVRLTSDEVFALNGYTGRYVTKRRPVLTIPALELFEGPMTEAPQVGRRYYVPRADHKEGYVEMWWEADDIDADCMKHGICFRTPEAAARIGLHIRTALSKFAGASHE